MSAELPDEPDGVKMLRDIKEPWIRDTDKSALDYIDKLRAALVAADEQLRLQVINRQELQARINDRDERMAELKNSEARAWEELKSLAATVVKHKQRAEQAERRVAELQAELATARADERERCEQAVDDAGGDNKQYHIDAIRALQPLPPDAKKG
jgi:chromosome segregation ATPase